MYVLHSISSDAPVHGRPSRPLAAMEQSLAGLGLRVVTGTTDVGGPGRHNGKPFGQPLHENGVTRWYFCKQMRFSMRRADKA